MKKLVAALLILAVIFQPIASSAAETKDIDCQFLLIITYKTTQKTLQDPEAALVNIKDLENINLPQRIAEYHKDYYQALETLAYSLIKMRETGTTAELIHNLTMVYSNLYLSYVKYSNTLITCSADTQVAATMRTTTLLFIKDTILHVIRNMIENYLNENSVNDKVNIHLNKESYAAGELVYIRVDLENITIQDPILTLVEWPTLTQLHSPNVITINDSVIEAYTIAPYATEIKTLPVYEFVRHKGELAVAVVVSGYSPDLGERVFAFKAFNVTYKVPKPSIIAPMVSRASENITLVIESDGFYDNVTIRVNGEPLINTSLVPGNNTFTISSQNITESENLLVIEVDIPPGPTYLGTTRSKPVIITHVTPEVSIESLEVIASIRGKATLEVKTKAPGVPLTLKAYLGPIPIHTSRILVEDGNQTISFFASVLPITPLKIEAIVDDNGTVYYASKNVIVINPLYLVITVAVILLAMTYPESLEKLYIIPIRVPKAGIRRIVYQVASTRSALLREKRIPSRIAEIYYRLLIRLRVRLPKPTETLREHYETIALTNPGLGKLWNLLRLVEADLYSLHKPRLDEALEELRKVLKNE